MSRKLDALRQRLQLKPLGAISFTGLRFAAVVRGWVFANYLRVVWRCRVGRRMVCFGWPRVAMLFGRVEIGDDVCLGRYCHLQCGLHGTLLIGRKTFIGDFVTIGAEERIMIGEDVQIAECAGIRDFDHIHSSPDIPIQEQGFVTQPITIGRDVWIARCVTILKGADIGAGSIIAANAVVRGHLEPNSIAAGVPAKKIKDRFGSQQPATVSTDGGQLLG